MRLMVLLTWFVDVSRFAVDTSSSAGIQDDTSSSLARSPCKESLEQSGVCSVAVVVCSGVAIAKPLEASQLTFLTEPVQHQSSPQQPARIAQHLLAAVREGDVEKTRALLAHGAKVNITDASQRTPLHIACSLGAMELVAMLLDAEGNIDACSASGQTPLHEACIGGHLEVLMMLLSEVTDLDHVDEIGRSAAHYSSLHGELECLNLLCNQGCDICLEDKLSRTGVHFAAINDHPDIIHCLMERGAELDTVDIDGKTPAHYAAKHGSLRALKELMKSNINLSQGWSIGV